MRVCKRMCFVYASRFTSRLSASKLFSIFCDPPDHHMIMILVSVLPSGMFFDAAICFHEKNKVFEIVYMEKALLNRAFKSLYYSIFC